MDSKWWKNKTWIQFTEYPNGIKLSLFILLLLCIGICAIIFGYRYPIYKQYYGIVEEDQNNVVRIAVLLNEMEEFQEVIKENKDIELISIDPNIQIESGQNVVLAYVKISISKFSKKLLVKNNIIPLKLKVRFVSFWDEIYQKWTKGVKYERT